MFVCVCTMLHRVLVDIYIFFFILTQNILIHYIGETCEKNAIIKIKSKVILVFFFLCEGMLGCCAVCIVYSPRPITLTIMKASPTKNDSSRVACVVLEFTGIPTSITPSIGEKESGGGRERVSECLVMCVWLWQDMNRLRRTQCLPRGLCYANKLYMLSGGGPKCYILARFPT